MEAKEAKKIADLKNEINNDPLFELKKAIKKRAKKGQYFAYFGRGVTEIEKKYAHDNGYRLEIPNKSMFRIYWEK